jgi:hypothetical protein
MPRFRLAITVSGCEIIISFIGPARKQKAELMSTPGAQSSKAQGEQPARTSTLPGKDVSHVERHYKAIGISAIASALSVLNRKSSASTGHRDLPAFLRKENLAA